MINEHCYELNIEICSLTESKNMQMLTTNVYPQQYTQNEQARGEKVVLIYIKKYITHWESMKILVNCK